MIVTDAEHRVHIVAAGSAVFRAPSRSLRPRTFRYRDRGKA